MLRGCGPLQAWYSLFGMEACETVISAYALMNVTEHNKFMLFPHPEEDSYLPCVQWPTP
jgi:hypothetical protein